MGSTRPVSGPPSVFPLPLPFEYGAWRKNRAGGMERVPQYGDGEDQHREQNSHCLYHCKPSHLCRYTCRQHLGNVHHQQERGQSGQQVGYFVRFCP